ncbi:hypothetical protein M3703_02050 [Mannheimia haemolytica]|nr:hypothetical protein M3703_02050 [Mannheimia haemolytica]
MTGNSNVNKLNVDNATITLDNNVGEPNTLNINSLSGSGVINFITYFAQTISDLINVEHASGAFKAKISQIGTPTNDQKIKLLETKSENNFNFTLDDSDIVRGDFRYTLKKEGLAYYLSPEKQKRLKQEKKPHAKLQKRRKKHALLKKPHVKPQKRQKKHALRKKKLHAKLRKRQKKLVLRKKKPHVKLQKRQKKPVLRKKKLHVKLQRKLEKPELCLLVQNLLHKLMLF